jgi:hypothetical protein
MSRCADCGKKPYACFCPPKPTFGWWHVRGMTYDLTPRATASFTSTPSGGKSPKPATNPHPTYWINRSNTTHHD